MAWPRQQTVRCPLYKRTTERGYETGTSTSAHAGTPGHARHGEEGRFAGENERTTSTDAPNWSPKMTVASLPPYFIYNAVVHAPLVAPTPPLIVHGTTDAAPLPEYAQEAYAAALGPKELVLIEAHNHIEFYDQAHMSARPLRRDPLPRTEPRRLTACSLRLAAVDRTEAAACSS
jgi:fermentation-respiration switch protein FrsA (DUF1100 family)